jgi:hypothetical protein
MSKDLLHDERMARFQRVIDRLEQVTKQANDLARMAAELRHEAGESMRLVKGVARATPGKRATRTRKGG